MSATVTVEHAAAHLKELIDGLHPGDEVILTANQRKVAKLIGECSPQRVRPAPGLGKGSIRFMAADFDDPMEEFKDYTERNSSSIRTRFCG